MSAATPSTASDGLGSAENASKAASDRTDDLQKSIDLSQRIAAIESREVQPAVRAFAVRLADQMGGEAVLFYGSNLRTGSLEGVLDFYVLMPGPQRERIWPRVSYHEWEYEGVPLRAKVAAMAMVTFAQAARGDLRDTTIWARFVQPSALVWAASEETRAELYAALCAASQTAARLAVALGPHSGTEQDYWRALFQATYKAELRVEKPGREDSILSANAAHFDGLLPAAMAAANIPFRRDGKIITPDMPRSEKARIKRWWRARRRLGKPLNVARLMKATTTFDGASRYAAWKLARHTGIEIEVTPWRERHPILAAPGVLYTIWRARR